MSKPSAPRREADNEAKAVLRAVRISPRKLDLVAATIRGKKAASAVNELTFSKKRIAGPNPWGEGATTLEWTLSSPPPFHQFETLPVITDAHDYHDHRPVTA